MGERPLLMSGPMVHAILDGMKTQTRRAFKNQSRAIDLCMDVPECRASVIERCRYGQLGDRLWVRETWHCPRQLGGTHQREKLIYRADADYPSHDYSKVLWAPSIFMPRWASRLTLEITDVRVERVQDISNDDCRAEGLGDSAAPFIFNNVDDSPLRQAYRALWDSLNAKRGHGWELNPWVWVLEFQRVDALSESVRPRKMTPHMTRASGAT